MKFSGYDEFPIHKGLIVNRLRITFLVTLSIATASLLKPMEHRQSEEIKNHNLVNYRLFGWVMAIRPESPLPAGMVVPHYANSDSAENCCWVDGSGAGLANDAALLVLPYNVEALAQSYSSQNNEAVPKKKLVSDLFSKTMRKNTYYCIYSAENKGYVICKGWNKAVPISAIVGEEKSVEVYYNPLAQLPDDGGPLVDAQDSFDE